MPSDAAGTDIHPITVISMPGKNGRIKATSCLIDQCCTGSGMIASKFVEILGLQVIQTSPHSFNIANRVLTMDSQVNLTHVKLPMLSKRREFKISLQIVPHQVIMNHGVILGLKTIQQINLDTSVCKSSISGSTKLVTPMVLRTFWTKEPLQKMVASLNTTHADPVQESPSQENLVVELTTVQQSDHHPKFSELGNSKVNQVDIKEGFLKIPLNQDVFVTKFLPSD